MPSAWIERARVTEVQLIGEFFSPGVRFATADGAYDGVIFWTFSRQEVVNGLGLLGWPVPGFIACARCGAGVDASASYCRSCGSSVGGHSDGRAG
jgi:hypothetical protein